MDEWMESLIKKKQKKKGNSLPLSSQPVPENMDDFEELNRFLRQPRLKREECPNPIPWWGVSGMVVSCLINLKCLVSINLCIQSCG